MTFSGGRAAGEEGTSEDRKLVRTESLGLIVKTPVETGETIIQIAQGAGGFLVTSNVNGGADATSASLSIRVPAEKFDEVRAQIRKLSLRVESESIDAQDVTKQYVDQEARLRNLRAQEQQYLGILRKAATVKDTLEVSDKLNEVRGAIEERQAEFEALSKQVETVAIRKDIQTAHDPALSQGVRMTEGTSQALLLKKIEPEYPHEAEAKGVEGDVVFRIIVGTDGRVEEVHLRRGKPILIEAAAKAVSQWQYQPYILNENAVEAETFATVRFRQPGKHQ